ncbi:phospholipase [Alkalibacillus haloalkaliphilus]|uniref:phospholipase n=1 Tax=Alkalibacillus haloalkaliphilus TaxID=94136 RepID=UPI0029364607|nr:phospholipase [Alkalibacillus haloalkaliphilus]MDV2580736.1 phospholipase [Alkalibacillus haloalkaliphilus]
MRNCRFCLPGYRYCGPGCSGPGKPVNKVDRACRQHDKCYYAGLNRRSCDQKFIRELDRLSSRCTREARHASAIRNVMKIRQLFYW